MEGYLNNPEATAEALHGRWLNTGDLGYMIDGHLVITGREKDLIIVNGRNYWPQDLEYVAEQFPGVRSGDAMAFSLQDGDVGEQVVMLVQCRETDTLARERMRSQIESRVRSEFACDCHVELVGQALTLARPGRLCGVARHRRQRRRWLGAPDGQGSRVTNGRRVAALRV
jgi:fatty-acyl-CoA synthase